MDSVPINDHNDLEKLTFRAERDIKYRFGGSKKGKLWRNTFSECGKYTIFIIISTGKLTLRSMHYRVSHKYLNNFFKK